MFKLKIQKFAQIENSEIEVKPFTIFFGESNTNKSYTLFAIYHLFNIIFSQKHREKIVQKINIFKHKKKGFPPGYPPDAEKHIPPFSIFTFDQASLENAINEELKNTLPAFFEYSLSLKIEDVALSFSFDKLKEKQQIQIYYQSSSHFVIFVDNKKIQFLKLLGEISLNPKKQQKKSLEIFDYPTNLSEEQKVLLEALPEVFEYLLVNDFLTKTIYFLPPARGSILDLQFALLKFMAEEFPVTGLLKEFIKTFTQILPIGIFEPPETEEWKEISSLIDEIFQGKFYFDRATNQIVYDRAGGKIPVTAAASSIKELMPLYYILKKGGNIQSKRIFIEEPEAHLHPALQIKVAYLLSFIVKHGGNVFLTTHSDYFVAAISNLIKLWHIKKLNPEKAKDLMKKYGIKEEYLVDPDNIRVYYFKKVDEQKVIVERIKINEYGITPASFQDTMNYIADMTDELHYELFNLLERES